MTARQRAAAHRDTAPQTPLDRLVAWLLTEIAFKQSVIALPEKEYHR